MADIRFQNVRKEFGATVALEEFSLEVPSPTLVVLVGPSGCGKTTLLRLLAGLETLTSGTIMLGDQRLDTLPPQQRDVAMVFQNYALYPHMTVRGNMSFGLKIRGVGRAEIEKRVEEVARSLEIAPLLDRKPGQLSGGQRQRVALGRAVVREPRVFLFDEPLSNLDARLRDEMRYLIKRLYDRLRTTTVYVTHDQVEAMTIGEMLVVMRDGRIHQVDTPQQCYARPADQFVASFLGSPPMNFVQGTFSGDRGTIEQKDGTAFGLPPDIVAAISADGERDLVIGVRPESLVPAPASGSGDADAGAGAASRSGDVAGGEMGRVGGREAGSAGGLHARLELRGRVLLRETLGHDVLTHIEVGERQIIMRGAQAPTDDVVVSADPSALHFFSLNSGRRIATPVPHRERR